MHLPMFLECVTSSEAAIYNIPLFGNLLHSNLSMKENKRFTRIQLQKFVICSAIMK